MGPGTGPQIERDLQAPNRGLGNAAFCAEIFLFCNRAVRGLAQGHLRAVLMEAHGCPHPS